MVVIADASQHMRLCFGYPDAATTDEGAKRLVKICKTEFGLPSQIANQKKFSVVIYLLIYWPANFEIQ